MFTQPLDPVADSLALSALIALLPLLTLFVLLGVLRLRAHWAGLGALAVALAIAVLGFGMPVRLAALSATEGAVFGLFPIMWIVVTAIWLYQVTVVAGRFDDLRTAFNRVSDDLRIQAVVIAFCFGGLIEALAGFGAPVAITGVMLVALGFPPLRAAALVLLANTAPVAFGAIATPIITAGTLTGIPYTEIGAYVGRQAPLLAAIVPLVLVYLVDGRRGVRQVWPAALVIGVSFGLAQFVSASYLSVELTDILASLFSLAAGVAFLRVWHPEGSAEASLTIRAEAERERVQVPVTPGGAAMDVDGPRDDALDRRRVLLAFFPYLVVIAVFSVANLWPAAKTAIAATNIKIHWPGLDGQVLSATGKPLASTVYTFGWLSSPGTLLLVCGTVTAIVYRVPARRAAAELVATLTRLRWAILTVAAVLALAYVMNLSGQTITIGTWIAGTGALFAFLSPILGWLGTAVTGSDTSSNALFATLQQAAGTTAGIDPTLLVAANTSGGVVGKMISPQNLTIAATAVGVPGREGDLFRGLILWSLALLLVLCVLIFLQSTPVLSWML